MNESEGIFDTPEAQKLAEDAQDLVHATAQVADEKISQARKRLQNALEASKECLGRAQERAKAGARAADETIRSHPYQSMGVAFGLGALIGFLLTRRNGD